MDNQELNQVQQHPQDVKYWGMPETTFSSLMHISQFAGFIIPIAGYILPIVMWATNRSNKFIDTNGKHNLNWLISSTIYIVVFGLLSMVMIGIPFFAILVVLAFVFPIIAAVKSANGVIWKYPLSIPFFKVKD